MGLRELHPGPRNCLKCGKLFPSRDVTTNRICPVCDKLNDKERIPKVYSSRGVHDSSSSRVENDSY